MLLDDFVYVDQPLATLVPLLMDPTAEWANRLGSAVDSSDAAGDARRGNRPGHRIAAVLRLGRGPRRLRPLAILSTARPRRTDAGVIVPIRWDPVSIEFMLPSLEGDIELSRFDQSVSRLELRGSYEVPLGGLGERLDRFAMHRAAEASVRTFLSELAEALDPIKETGA